MSVTNIFGTFHLFHNYENFMKLRCILFSLLLVTNFVIAEEANPPFLIQLSGYSYLDSQLDFTSSLVDISIDETESKTASQDDSYVMFNRIAKISGACPELDSVHLVPSKG